MHYVYVLKSLRDSMKYVGVTKDLDKRIKAHNWGRVSSTKSRRPFELIYVEEFESREIAEKRERFLKSGDGRKILKSLIKSMPATEASAGSPPPIGGEGAPPKV